VFFMAAIVSLALYSNGAEAGEVSVQRDPWVGTYVTKEVEFNSVSFGITKLTISAGKTHSYNVKMEINHLIEETGGKPKVIQGYGDLYGPNDKESPDRLFLYFPSTKSSPFVEIVPGRNIHPATGSSELTGLTYTYFEKSRFPKYDSGQLVRMTTPKVKKPK